MEKTKRIKVEDVIQAVDLSMEALTDDLVPAIIGDEGGFFICCKMLHDGIRLTWSWQRLGIDEKQKEFKIEPGETADQFKAKVDAYFYALCIMLANL